MNAPAPPDPAAGVVLTLNAGSSSLKFAVFASGASPVARLRGQVSGLDRSPHLDARHADGTVAAERRWPDGATPSFDEVLAVLLGVVQGEDGHAFLAGVGHRVVHGGARHVGPARVTPALIDELHALTRLDPLHLPHNIKPIEAIASAHPGVPQVVCFDTAFHHTLPAVARRTGLPRALEEDGVRRYGFHGLSYEYVASRLDEEAPALAGGRVVVAHLGAGASLCALRAGRSVATTMGFSTLDGLLMSTRCGSLDPGIVLHLARSGRSVGEIEDMLYARSGLLGVSGTSGDIRDLLASDDPRAADAIELFVYRIANETAAMAGALGGIDGLVFTAGIGEHAAPIRALVAARLAWLGVELDAEANAAGAAVISRPGGAVETRVMATDEETTIARHTVAMLGAAARA